MDVIAKYWAPIWAIVTTGALVVMALLSKTYAKKETVTDLQMLSKTYAKKETVTDLQKDLESVKGKVDELPSKDELHNLHLEIANLRGDLKAVGPQLTQVAKVSDLLLQNEFTKEKA